MTLFSGEAPHYLGHRQFLNILGRVKNIPVEIKTYQNKHGRWEAKLVAEKNIVHSVITGASEKMQDPVKFRDLGFETELDLLNALPTRHIAILGTFLELAEPEAQ